MTVVEASSHLRAPVWRKDAGEDEAVWWTDGVRERGGRGVDRRGGGRGANGAARAVSTAVVCGTRSIRSAAIIF